MCIVNDVNTSAADVWQAIVRAWRGREPQPLVAFIT